jgi:hypothetical protein
MDRNVVHRDWQKALTPEQATGRVNNASPSFKARPWHALRPSRQYTDYGINEERFRSAWEENDQNASLAHRPFRLSANRAP